MDSEKLHVSNPAESVGVPAGGRRTLRGAAAAAGLGLVLAASLPAGAALADDASSGDGADGSSSALQMFSSLGASAMAGGSAAQAATTADAASAQAQAQTAQASQTQAAQAQQAQQTQDGFAYTLDADGDATLTGYTGTSAEVEVPAELDGHAVVAVGARAFAGNTALASVVLPDSVVQIGDYAFSGCTALASIQLPAALQWLGAGALSNCTALTVLDIPATLTACGTTWSSGAVSGPLSGCTALAEVDVADGATVLAPYLFAGCDALAVVTLPDTISNISAISFTATGQLSSSLVIRGIEGSAAQRFAEDNGLTFQSSTVPATAVALDQAEVSLFRGKTVKLTATAEPADTTDRVTWQSSNPEVATVDAEGTVTAVAAGSATITATAGSVSATCAVTVTVPVESIALNRASFEIEAGATRQLETTVKPDDATDKSVTWESSNTGVATVAADGTVTGVGKGSATLTATANDGSGVVARARVEVVSDIHVATAPEQLASPHDYGSDCLDCWTYTLTGAEALDVTFDARTYVEDTFDFIEVYDASGTLVGSYTGSALAGATVRVTGDTVTVKLVTDGQTSAWGFAVTGVAAVQLDGWRVVDGVTYYYVNGAPLKGEQLLDDGWHYFNVNTGAMLTGLVYLPDGRLVYYDARGVMVTGDVLLQDGWHYFDPVDGHMHTGLVCRPDGWRYYDRHGVRCSGPVVIDGRTYYFNDYTGLMVNDPTYVDVDISNTTNVTNETNITNVDVDQTVINVDQTVVVVQPDEDIDADEGDLSDDDQNADPDEDDEGLPVTDVSDDPVPDETPDDGDEQGDQSEGDGGGEQQPSGEQNVEQGDQGGQANDQQSADQGGQGDQSADQGGDQGDEGDQPADQGDQGGQDTDQGDQGGEQQPADDQQADQGQADQAADQQQGDQPADQGDQGGDEGLPVTDVSDEPAADEGGQPADQGGDQQADEGGQSGDQADQQADEGQAEQPADQGGDQQQTDQQSADDGQQQDQPVDQGGQDGEAAEQPEGQGGDETPAEDQGGQDEAALEAANAAAQAAYQSVLESGSYVGNVPDAETLAYTWDYALFDINADGVDELLVRGDAGDGFSHLLVYTYDADAQQAVYVDDLYGYGAEGQRYSAAYNAVVYAPLNPTDDASVYHFVQLNRADNGTFEFDILFSVGTDMGVPYYWEGGMPLADAVALTDGSDAREISSDELASYLSDAVLPEYQPVPAAAAADEAPAEEPAEQASEGEGAEEEPADQAEQPADDGQPAEEAPAEEQPSEEAPAEEPADQQPADDAQPAEDAAATDQQPAEEAPAEGDGTDQAPAEEQPAEEAPADDQQGDQAAADQQPSEETPAEDAAATDQPADQEAAEEAPADQEAAPAEDAAATEAPAEEAAPEEEPAPAAVELSAEQSANLSSLTQLYLRAWERAYADGGAPATDANMVVAPGAVPAIDTQLVELALGLDGEGLDGYYARNGQANLAGLNVSATGDGAVYAGYDALPMLLRSVYGSDVSDVSYIVSPLVEAGAAQDTGDGWTFYQTGGSQSSALWIANVQSADGATYSFDAALLDGTGSPNVDACTLRYFHVEAVADEGSAFGFHLVSVTESYGLEGTFPDAVRVQTDLANAIAAGAPLAQPVTSYL